MQMLHQYLGTISISAILRTSVLATLDSFLQFSNSRQLGLAHRRLLSTLNKICVKVLNSISKVSSGLSIQFVFNALNHQ